MIKQVWKSKIFDEDSRYTNQEGVDWRERKEEQSLVTMGNCLQAEMGIVEIRYEQKKKKKKKFFILLGFHCEFPFVIHFSFQLTKLGRRLIKIFLIQNLMTVERLFASFDSVGKSDQTTLFLI